MKSETYYCPTLGYVLDYYVDEDAILHAKKCQDTFHCAGWQGLLGDCSDLDGSGLLGKGWVESLRKREELEIA